MYRAVGGGQAVVDTEHGEGDDQGSGTPQLIRLDVDASLDPAADRMQLAAIDHRLKSAFLVIAGWARTLDTEWDRLTPEQQHQGITAIRARAEAMVVQTELLLAQLRPGALLPTMDDSTDLAVLCRQAVDAYDASTTHRVVYRGSTRMAVAAPLDSVDQILEQLLENAIKFSPPGSLVEASVYDTEEGGMLLVRDEGCGIPDGIDIFRPFTRGNDEVGGSGVGLAVVASLARGAGGTVKACRLPSGGSQFTVVLPKAPAA